MKMISFETNLLFSVMLCLVSLAVGTARGELVVQSLPDRADVSSLDLGDMRCKAGLQIKSSFVLKNQLTETISILQTRLSCGCVQVTGVRQTIAAGASVEFEVVASSLGQPESQEQSSHTQLITFLYKGVSDPS